MQPVASFNPDHMVPPFDLVGTLESSGDYSHGTEVVSLYSYPTYLTTNVRRVLSRSSKRLEWGAAMSCLIDHGVRHYYGSPVVKSLIAAFKAIDTNDAFTSTVVEHLESWRKQPRFSLTDPTNLLGFQKRQAFKAPDPIRKGLSGLAAKLGLSQSVFGAVCVMVALEEQTGVVPEHAVAIRADIDRFNRLLIGLDRRLSGLIRLAEEGLWP